MKYLMLTGRWVVWLMILALESTVGLPWISLWLFSEWLSLSHDWLEQGLVLLIMSILLVTSYQVSLPVAGLILGFVWLAHGSKKRFWGVLLMGGLMWWLKRSELQVSWAWVSSIFSWLVIGIIDGRKILWKKSKFHI